MKHLSVILKIFRLKTHFNKKPLVTDSPSCVLIFFFFSAILKSITVKPVQVTPIDSITLLTN